MRVLLAFDKFKDALSAAEACATVAEALPRGTEIDACPLTDGGEGFAEILTRAVRGDLIEVQVQGPRGDPAHARMGFVESQRIPAAARAMLGLGDGIAEKVAIIEMAQASGLALLPGDRRNPWETSSVGTGELMRTAHERGAKVILLGVGGTATHDIGIGALAALGIRPVDDAGQMVNAVTPSHWGNIKSFSGHLPPAFPRIQIACDVNNPLLGPIGAAAVYAPQKGLEPDDYPRMESATERVSAALCRSLQQPLSLRETPGAGAAGGISFGLMCAAGATLLPGFDLVAAWFDLDARIAAADVVITGEGRFDDSSLQGKGPGAVARLALALRKPTHVFAGRVDVKAPPSNLVLHAISPAGAELSLALAGTRENLGAAVRRTFPQP